jgi:hydroxyacylglutathione hydrolase
MKIKRIVGGNIDSNGYIIFNCEGGDGYIIDPGYNPDKFLKLIKELDITLLGIILTHHHYDHVGGVDKIRKTTGCKVYMQRQDADVYKGEVDILLEHGDRLLLGDESILILNTPGHTRGSICLYAEKSKIVFTGDTIFNVDLGRTDLAGGSYDEMKRSIKEIIDQWANDITIYPGHGDSATMKYVRSYNLEYIEIMKT